MTEQRKRSSTKSASGEETKKSASSEETKKSASSEETKRSRPPSAGAVARRASAELAELLDREPEGVVSVERTDDGWQVGVEFVELRRIPDTADVLAEYFVETDRRGQLVAYRRVRRYVRGRTEDGR